MKRRKWREVGWTGTWRYASARSMEAIQSPWRTDRSTDWMVTIWKGDTSTKRMRWERAMTGRHDLEFFHTMNRWLKKAGEVSGASSTAPMAMKPKVTSSRAAPVMGWKKALGWEQWKRRSAEEGQTIAQPQHLYNPSLCTPVPPGLPMEGQTTAGKGPERRRPPPPETRRPGRRSPPPAPLWSAYDHQYERRNSSASRTACHA